jgi:uroporphyrinogen-III synthase
MKPGPLSGRGIVITRPREHALPLAELIRSVGGNPVLFPTIEILPLENREALSNLITRLDSYHLAIFVSPTAVGQGLGLVNATRIWPGNLRVAAVGAGTAKALAGCGFSTVIAPAVQADSEALAALPELQDLGGRSVVIFRGQGGREWLRTVLEARGARVEYAECYRRVRPTQDSGPLLALWRRGAIEAASIASTEGLQNFFDMLGTAGEAYLRATPVFVPHPRIAQAAEKLGVRRAIVTGHGDDRMVAEMAAFFARV